MKVTKINLHALKSVGQLAEMIHSEPTDPADREIALCWDELKAYTSYALVVALSESDDPQRDEAQVCRRQIELLCSDPDWSVVGPTARAILDADPQTAGGLRIQLATAMAASCPFFEPMVFPERGS